MAESASASGSVAARPEIKASVTQLSAEASKPKPTPAPQTEAAKSVAKEKVKVEKPSPSQASSSTRIDIIPAQVPSPSLAGPVASPPMQGMSASMTAAPGAGSTFRFSPARPSTATEPTPGRMAVAQVTGGPAFRGFTGAASPTPSADASAGPPPAASSSTPAGAAPTAFAGAVPAAFSSSSVGAAPAAFSGSSVGAAAAAFSRSLPQPVPTQVAEIVSRTPVPASVSLPPSASVPPSSSVPPVGYATALTTLAKAAGAGVPKDSPAAVAVGRAIARGDGGVKKTPAGKLSTRIAKKYQIIFVTSEVAPWSKTGGLGEAMDGLPVALAALGHRVMTIAPRYDQYAEAWDTSYWSEVPMGQNCEPVHAFHAYQSKVDRVFVDHDCFLAKTYTKTGSMLYGPEWGKDFADNQWRFVYFAKAVLKIIQELPLGGFPYGGDSIVVVNDWHCAMVPVYLSLMKKSRPQEWANAKTAMIIHNAVFQGRFDRDDPDEPPLEVYGLSEEVMSTFTFNMPIKVGRKEPKVRSCLNWMASAAKYVDKILTVSPTYAWELLNLPEMGCELDEIFLSKGVTGIVNGVKESVSPMNTSFVKKAEMISTFGLYDVDAKKADLKATLQETYGLPKDPNVALCVFVGRMDLQKGYDYLLAALQAIMGRLDLQLIVIGTGRADLVASTKALAKKFPEKVYLAGWCGAERYAMVAGADYNLMPSRWEPCGLAQLESMRFGTLPVVAQTGGLVDTVQDMVTGIHLGGAVSVEKELDASSVELMARALEKCVSVYADKAQTSKMRKAAMAAGHEFTWSNSALQYEAVFEGLGAKNVLPFCGEDSVTLEADKVVA